jgi:phosphate-selective porin OprO/OprP
VVGVPTTAEFDQQSGYAARIAFNPIHGADYDVHLGANIQSILNPADTTGGPVSSRAVRLQERPELRVSGLRLVDTGAINSDGLTAYGLEAGASWKNLYAAGEWNKIEVNRQGASPFDPSFEGWYLQGAWTITGERHAWTNANGGFTGVKPAKVFNPAKGTWGAWEIAARYSELDLNDRAGVFGVAAPAGGIRGGEQKITTLGLNWYPNNVLRFLLDYQWARVDRLSATGADIGEDVNVVSFRSQFAF